MSITLRDNTTNNIGKGAELTYLEMDTNLESFYYSSSLSGNILTLHTTGSTAHSVDLSSLGGYVSTVSLVGTDLIFTGTGNAFNGTVPLGSFLDNTNIGSTDLSLTGTRSLTFNGSDLTFAAGSNSFYITGLSTAAKSQIIGYDSTSGELVAMNTASLGASGADTEVQFNDQGVFGSDGNFTWNKTNNYLTLKASIGGPSLRLINDTPAAASGVTLGYISAYQDTLAAADIGGFKIVSDGGFSNGNVPTRFDILTTPLGTETPTVKLSIKHNGRINASEYGSGTFTGTAAKWLAVDSSGYIIEEDAPTAPSRPATADAAESLIKLNGGQNWNFNTGTIPASGTFTSNSTSVNSITAISIHYTDAANNNQFERLKRMCESGNATQGYLYITQNFNPFSTAAAQIKQVVDNGTYFTVYLANWGGGGTLTTLTNGASYDFDMDNNCPLRVALLDKRYNRLTLANNTGTDVDVRLFAPSTVSPGDHLVVELLSTASNTNKIYIQYVLNNSGAATSYDDRWNQVFVVDEATPNQQLFITDTYQMALLEFRVTPTGNLALISAEKVNRPA